MSDEVLIWQGSIDDDGAMQALGAGLAAMLLRTDVTNRETAFVVRLEGNLGAGKTTLVRGLLQSLGNTGPVRSPTYTLIEPYEVAVEGRVMNVTHMDLYRLADPEELEFIGLRDLISEPGLMLVEWPDRGGDLLPPDGLKLCIEYAGTGRLVEIFAVGKHSTGTEDWCLN